MAPTGTLPVQSDADLIVAGGGAAGFFAAITAAEAGIGRVVLLESTAHLLAKVRVSGGGRCNVTHACFDPAELARHYPRGGRELIGAFHRWQPRDTVEWFERRGVALKTEEDGRMFPVTDSSATVVDCLLRAAAGSGVTVVTQTALRTVRRGDRGFDLTLGAGDSRRCSRLLLATGGGRSSEGFVAAAALGHTIEPLVPSLFTFHIDDPRLRGLEGLAAPRVSASAEKLRSDGPLLITHWGVSGPAVLKLSAWGARAFAACGYRFVLRINWTGAGTVESVRADLASARTGPHARQRLANANPFGLPARLWERLAQSVTDGPTTWGTASNVLLDRLAREVAAGEFAVAGKSLNKEEFVTCGGVRLAEVDFRTMESKRCPGLHFAGEMLDLDGVTGGFNFQAAWTTGRIAGQAIAAAALAKQS